MKRRRCERTKNETKTSFTGRIDLRAIGRVILNQLQLRQLDVLVDDEWHVRIPLEDHFVRRVRHCWPSCFVHVKSHIIQITKTKGIFMRICGTIVAYISRLWKLQFTAEATRSHWHDRWFFQDTIAFLCEEIGTRMKGYNSGINWSWYIAHGVEDRKMRNDG